MNKIMMPIYDGQETGKVQGRGANKGVGQDQNTQLTQIIQQVAELKDSLHNFIDQEEYDDAAMISASGMLEGHLNHYYQMALRKEQQKPGLKTF